MRFRLFVCLLFVAFLAVPRPTMAEGIKRWFVETVRNAMPQVSSPAAQHFGVNPTAGPQGFHTSGSNFVIGQNAPYFGDATAYGELIKEKGAVVTLDPWGAITDTRIYEPTGYAGIPVMIRFYRDQKLTDYVGAFGVIFWNSGGYDNSMSFMVQEGWIKKPNSTSIDGADGTTGQNTVPHPPQQGVSKKVKFPKEWRNGTFWLQILNNVPDSIGTIRVDGSDRLPLAFKEIYTAQLHNYGQYGGNATVQISFKSTGGAPLGVAHFPITVPASGVLAQQIIVGFNDLQRQ